MLKLGYISTLAILLASTAHADSMQWSSIRDGSLYLQPTTPDTLNVSWKPAWQSDANQEQLYLLGPTGQLLEQLDIQANQPYGKQALEITPAEGDYRLQVPGYSFRGFTITHDSRTAAQFEPSKVHFSAEVGRGSELYFKIMAGQQAVLAGKFYGGVKTLQATRLSDGHKVRLDLKKHQHYGEFDQAPIPPADTDEVWRLSLGGSGKAAFWLDGSANLFAQDVNQLHPLRIIPGQVQLDLSKRIRGQTPRLGVALPYVEPPKSTYKLLDKIAPRAANFYSFVDVITQQPQREINFRKLYSERFNIDHDITLLAGTGRRPVLEADEETVAGLNAWLADRIQLADQGVHYLAFADEPNLNYPDYASFANYFEQMLAHVKATPEASKAGVRIAIPASSRLIDGPFRRGSGQRRGIDWAGKLLARHGTDIDALAWHEWMVRDLLATRKYSASVRAAAELVGLDAAGRPNKALLLSQTNISSGPDLSPYQQDTYYAGLWWASVVINASQDGLLTMLNWFQVADEPDYPKGMLAQVSDTEFSLKPVAKVQQFIQQHWLSQVQALDNSSFEVDVLAMTEAGKHVLLGVNKAVRPQSVRINGPEDLCQQHLQLNLLNPAGQVSQAFVPCDNNRARFELPAENLFTLSWRDQ